MSQKLCEVYTLAIYASFTNISLMLTSKNICLNFATVRFKK